MADDPCSLIAIPMEIVRKLCDQSAMIADAPPSLVTIPTEMVWKICDHLIEDNDKFLADHAHKPWNPTTNRKTWESTVTHFPALGNLARTCKHLQRLTEPRLYQSIEICVESPMAFINIIRRFSRFRSLAAFVKELRITGTGFSVYTGSVEQLYFLLREGLRLGLRLSPSGRELHGELESIMIDVLLCQAKAAEAIFIMIPQCDMATYDCSLGSGELRSDLLYARRLPNSFALESLHHLDVQSPYPNWRGFSPSIAVQKASVRALLAHTPALTRLRIGGPFYEEGMLIPRPLPKLRDIQVVHLFDEDIARLAALCPQLRRCRFGVDNWVGPQSQLAFANLNLMRDNPEAAPAQLAKRCLFLADWVLERLLPMRRMLEELDMGWCGLVILQMRHLRLLRRFSALRSLHLGVVRWPDGDNSELIAQLPPSIEFLCLGGHGMPVVEIAALLVKAIRRGRLPNLKCFRYTMYRETLQPGTVERLGEVFGGTGVDYGEKPLPRISPALEAQMRTQGQSETPDWQEEMAEELEDGMVLDSEQSGV